eukprot:m.96404 g.96404  ORF g.96404 m.96404 type:complete len:61 (-) comp8966_c0_seq5:1572-1754(-)
MKMTVTLVIQQLALDATFTHRLNTLGLVVTDGILPFHFLPNLGSLCVKTLMVAVVVVVVQ